MDASLSEFQCHLKLIMYLACQYIYYKEKNEDLQFVVLIDSTIANDMYYELYYEKCGGCAFHIKLN